VDERLRHEQAIVRIAVERGQPRKRANDYEGVRLE
jgi:hypothetical protein